MRLLTLRRTRRAALLALCVPAASGCRVDGATGPNLAALGGQYAVRTIDGQPLPVDVATAYDQGRVTGGSLSVDGRNYDFWLTLTVVPVSGPGVQYSARGTVQPHPQTPGDSALFVSRNGNILFSAALRDGVLTASGLRALRVEFRRAGGYGYSG